ncbi:lytic murein transglycosylase B [Chitinilyticum piscinae]|uniref:Lytic murein transglycosylase B n=1 Tax=Chitinilyticum piscinae TaxID=2866724 RepID=A0A8J7FKQ5_9NEIS|nr:lytic murein transglycosylase B [Chitinilyticum piscinae]MBE9609495.1 lytic murein transglycosylase B [Chitinilyticum piscinae]
MTRFLRALGASALLFAASAHADEAMLQRDDVKAYLDEISAQYGFNRSELDTLFMQVTPKPNILNFFDRPSTSKPWYEFRPNFVTQGRAISGARFWRANAELVGKISKAYQVEPEVVLAILNVETGYGKNQGSFRVIDVLSTVAFDYPRRAEYFRRELTEFLLLARAEGWDPLGFKGSYAGAMGWPQFMPSSFRNFAQDWDKDGHHDIWNNPGDALASAANYLKEHGWQQGKPAYAAVNFSGEAEPLLAEKFNLKYTVAELMEKGVQPLTEQDTREKAVYFALETAPGETSHYLGYTNFYVITRYNKSTLYATAVLQLAEEIKTAYHSGADLATGKKTGKPAAKPASKTGSSKQKLW